jgi:CHASE2 domain-containing sensor protein
MGSSVTKTILLGRRAFRRAAVSDGMSGQGGGAGPRNWFGKSALAGATLTVLCGWLLWGTPLGESWVNTSYDYLFRFGSRTVTNRIALVQMDDESYEQLGQTRGAWDRALYTRLLKKLAADKSSLVVFDIHFKSAQLAATDSALAEAMREQGHVVLMADVRDSQHPGLAAAKVLPPQELFLKAAAGCGVGHTSSSTLKMARQHWPFFAPGDGDFHSLGWVAAEKFGKKLDPTVEQQWLRYYGEHGAWEPIPYHLALAKPLDYFSNKIVFIGNRPEKSDPGSPEQDKFRTPFTRWNEKAVGGMEIMATTFLNLVNGDWLRRPPAWIEAALLALTGILIGGGLCQLKPWTAGLAAAGIFLAVMVAFVSLSYYSNYWFPWLVIAGGQVPCALAWAWVSSPRRESVLFLERFPGYTTVGEPLGEGAYGKVWLARNATGQWQALKEIERAKFEDPGSYEREFRGIQSYKPVSHQHLGLLHIDHVNRNDQQGYFYYVMELGDPLVRDWQEKGAPYKPLDLASLCSQWESGRLLPLECIRIGIQLLEPLDFLHQQGLVHRDIKPSNIVFVNGRPKLADVGLVRKASENSTWVGTPPYMPPRPEPPGTATADIYAMGLVLYVISSGKKPDSFPELLSALVEQPEFMRLNEIICKACQPTASQRYASAAEMLEALRTAQRELNREPTRKI